MGGQLGKRGQARESRRFGSSRCLARKCLLLGSVAASLVLLVCLFAVPITRLVVVVVVMVMVMVDKAAACVLLFLGCVSRAGRCLLRCLLAGRPSKQWQGDGGCRCLVFMYISSCAYALRLCVCQNAVPDDVHRYAPLMISFLCQLSLSAHATCWGGAPRLAVAAVAGVFGKGWRA